MSKIVKLNTPILIAFITLIFCSACAPIGYKKFNNLYHFSSAQCNDTWQSFADRVDRNESYDAQTYPLPHFPYLRVNRFFASFNFQSFSSEQKKQWLAEVYELGKEAIRVEWQNSGHSYAYDEEVIALSQIETCIKDKIAKLITDDEFWFQLESETNVPDNYINWRQWLGLYPLFKPIIGWQVNKLNTVFKTEFGQYLPKKTWRYYRAKQTKSQSHNEMQNIMTKARERSALGLFQVNKQEQQTLFEYFAPHFEIETSGFYDKPGAVVWHNKHLQVRHDKPTTYTLMQHTRFDGKILLQLVYVIWFSERPKKSWLDIYGGQLDGLMWRVTLDEDATPLLFDSVHPCGCYYKLYPNKTKLKFTGLLEDEESVVILPFTPEPKTNQQTNNSPPLISLNSQHHYVVNIRNAITKDIKTTIQRDYELLPYNGLRALTLNSSTVDKATRSIFSTTGLIDKTQRLERFLLWMTGVRSPGAMRQWGNHATAFSSRRHFDDPDFLNQYFKRSIHD